MGARHFQIACAGRATRLSLFYPQCSAPVAKCTLPGKLRAIPADACNLSLRHRARCTNNPAATGPWARPSIGTGMALNCQGRTPDDEEHPNRHGFPVHTFPMPTWRCCTPLTEGNPRRGSVRSEGAHEPAIRRPLPHREPAQLRRGGAQAGRRRGGAQARRCAGEAVRRRGALSVWLDKALIRLAPHDGRPGRSALFCDAAIRLRLAIRVLFRLPLRQSTGTVASLRRIAGLERAVPGCTTLCRRQKTLAIRIR